MDNEQGTALMRPTAGFYLALASLFLVPFIASFNAVILSSALPAITIALNAPSEKAFWCGSGFLLARTVTTPIFGAFSEAFGRRIILTSALIVFIFATALCVAAQNIDWLLAARVVQGAAAGGLNAVVSVVLTDMVELRNRGKVTGLFSLSQFLGIPGGLILGGAIAEYTSWRWVFVVTLPVCLVAGCGIMLFLKLDPPEASFKMAVKSFDWVGMVMLSGSLIGLMYGILVGGNTSPWDSAGTLVPLVFGVVGIAGFVVFEGRIPAKPMIPPRIFANRTAASGFIASALHGLIFWATSFYLILYFLGSLGHSLLKSSVDCLPGIMMLVASSASSGFIFARMKRFQKLMLVAWCLVIIGSALLSRLGPNSNQAAQYGYQMIGALGGGIILPGRLLAVQASQKQADVAIATTIVAFMLNMGQAFGVGIGGTILQNRWDSLLRQATEQQAIPPKFQVTGARVESAWKITSTFPTKWRILYQEITAESISTLFIFCTAGAGVGLLTSFISKDLSLNKDARSSQRFVMGPRLNETADAAPPLPISQIGVDSTPEHQEVGWFRRHEWAAQRRKAQVAWGIVRPPRTHGYKVRTYKWDTYLQDTYL